MSSDAYCRNERSYDPYVVTQRMPRGVTVSLLNCGTVRNPTGRPKLARVCLLCSIGPRDQEIEGAKEGTKARNWKRRVMIDPRIPVSRLSYISQGWESAANEELNRLILLYKVVAMNQ